MQSIVSVTFGLMPIRCQKAFLIGYQQPTTLLCIILLRLLFVFRASIIVWVDQQNPSKTSFGAVRPGSPFATCQGKETPM